ncbi:MAG: ubiquinol-cytochrome c reductase iron-sulfur subunit [Anaerolineales bacterium]
MTDAEEQPAAEGLAGALEDLGVASPALTRREFLYYLWASSMAVFLAGAGGVTIWFALPRFREGEFGGVFIIPIEDIPAPDSDPKEFAEGRFWLVNLGEGAVNDPRQPEEYEFDPGLRVLYKVCVHLGCLYKWVPTNDRFECPCHGSKFLKSDSRIGGPANRNLDQFIVQVIDASGNVLEQTEATWLGDREGSTLSIPSGAVALRIDTGQRMNGAPNTAPGGGT